MKRFIQLICLSLVASLLMLPLSPVSASDDGGGGGGGSSSDGGGDGDGRNLAPRNTEQDTPPEGFKIRPRIYKHQPMDRIERVKPSVTIPKFLPYIGIYDGNKYGIPDNGRVNIDWTGLSQEQIDALMAAIEAAQKKGRMTPEQFKDFIESLKAKGYAVTGSIQFTSRPAERVNIQRTPVVKEQPTATPSPSSVPTSTPTQTPTVSTTPQSQPEEGPRTEPGATATTGPKDSGTEKTPPSGEKVIAVEARCYDCGGYWKDKPSWDIEQWRTYGETYTGLTDKSYEELSNLSFVDFSRLMGLDQSQSLPNDANSANPVGPMMGWQYMIALDDIVGSLDMQTRISLIREENIKIVDVIAAAKNLITANPSVARAYFEAIRENLRTGYQALISKGLSPKDAFETAAQEAKKEAVSVLQAGLRNALNANPTSLLNTEKIRSAMLDPGLKTLGQRINSMTNVAENLTQYSSLMKNGPALSTPNTPSTPTTQQRPTTIQRTVITPPAGSVAPPAARPQAKPQSNVQTQPVARTAPAPQALQGGFQGSRRVGDMSQAEIASRQAELDAMRTGSPKSTNVAKDSGGDARTVSPSGTIGGGGQDFTWADAIKLYNSTGGALTGGGDAMSQIISEQMRSTMLAAGVDPNTYNQALQASRAPITTQMAAFNRAVAAARAKGRTDKQAFYDGLVAQHRAMGASLSDAAQIATLGVNAMEAMMAGRTPAGGNRGEGGPFASTGPGEPPRGTTYSVTPGQRYPNAPDPNTPGAYYPGGVDPQKFATPGGGGYLGGPAKPANENQALADKLSKELQDAIDYREMALLNIAKQKAEFWREVGLDDEQDMLQYQDLYQELLDLHDLRGKDFSKVHSMFDIINRRVQAMDMVYTGKISGIMPEREKALAAQFERKALHDSLRAAYLSALASGTPQEAEQALRNFKDVVDAIAGANVNLMLEESKRIAIEEEAFVWSLVPIVGDAMGLAEAAEGKDVMGRDLGWVERSLGFLGAFGALGDAADLGKALRAAPKGTADVLGKLVDRLKGLPPAEQAAIKASFSDKAYDALYDFASAFQKTTDNAATALGGGAADWAKFTKSLRHTTSPLDPEAAKRVKAMQVARDAYKEQQAAKALVDGLAPKDLKAFKETAWSKVDSTSPAIGIDKLADPSRMTKTDYDELGRSLGLPDDVDLHAMSNPSAATTPADMRNLISQYDRLRDHLDLTDAQIQNIMSRPDMVTGLVEQVTGMPIDHLAVQAKAVGNKDYRVMRNSNAEGLERLRNGEGVAKTIDITTQSGAGGLIPVDQKFSKLSKELAEAQRSGNKALIDEINAKIAKKNLESETIMGKNVPPDAKTGQGGLIVAQPTSTLPDGRTVVAADVNGQQVMVAYDAKSGEIFDLATNRNVSGDTNVSLIKDAQGNPTPVEIWANKDGTPFVADADVHIWGMEKQEGIIDVGPGGYMSRGEERAVLNEAIAGREAGVTQTVVHGQQSRAFDKELSVDKSFYVVENGQLRFIQGDEQLKDLVHAHRLEGVTAPIDGRWGWGTYTAEGFTNKTAAADDVARQVSALAKSGGSISDLSQGLQSVERLKGR